jgi:hypothetical protein
MKNEKEWDQLREDVTMNRDDIQRLLDHKTAGGNMVIGSSKSQIRPGRTLRTPVPVQFLGTEIKFQFDVLSPTGCDLGFVLVPPRGTEEAYPVIRMGPPEGGAPGPHHHGSLIAHEKGTYVAVFDNSYSWSTAKDISYLIETFKPQGPDEIALTDDLDQANSALTKADSLYHHCCDTHTRQTALTREAAEARLRAEAVGRRLNRRSAVVAKLAEERDGMMERLERARAR